MTITPDTLRTAHLDTILDGYCSQSSPPENLIGILADAMHWCLLNGEDFAALLATAQWHVETETGVSDGKPQREPVPRLKPEPQFPIGRRPLVNRLLELARKIADFADAHTESLSFEDYGTLMELEAKLLASGNLLKAFNASAFLDGQIREAEEVLAWIKQRVQTPD